MRVSWLADVLRQSGVEVIELAGWRGRGASLNSVLGVVWHHTATGPNVSDQNVANLLRDGHSTLPGPLSQLGLDRQGRWWVIADGLCNHNGYGLWGNQSIGIEAFNTGTGEPWSDAQYRSWVIGTRAICKQVGLTSSKVMGHKETDPKRKIDPAGVDMNKARNDIAHPPQEELMVKIWNIGGHLYGALYVNGGKTPIQAWHLATQAQADHLISGGAPQENQAPDILKLVEVIGTTP